MSAMGQAAEHRRARLKAPAPPSVPLAVSSPATALAKVLGPPPAEAPAKSCHNQPDCPGGAEEASVAPGGQAETSIAVSGDGRHVVVGFNDTRGFARSPISVSGFQYSDNGGRTFAPSDQLPSAPQDAIGTELFPQVFGDPDVKWLGGCTFVYSSILLTVKEYVPGVPTPVQTLSLHRSRDCGHTWEGPFEVTAATNPNGFIYSDGSAVDAADKEFIDFDPGSGRLIMTWTNFTHPLLAPSGVQMMSTFTDDVLRPGDPTFEPAAVISASELDGQASIPRFGPNGQDVYVAWRRFSGFLGNINAVARSSDGGRTWGAPVETSLPFFTMDHVLGNDRVNSSPSLAVGKKGAGRGTVFLVYAQNDSGDGADIAFQTSRDRGATWSPPVFVNARPGNDRAQWFPWVTVDDDLGRAYVLYNDQGLASSGDLSQVSYTFTDNRGRSWSAPVALSDRPFHAGWGNDTGQPNLGDYNQAVAQNGHLYASFAVASRPPLGFVDGQPGTGMSVPDVAVNVLPSGLHPFDATPVDLAAVDLQESGANGFVDPRELFQVRLTLRNGTDNPLSRATLKNLRGTLRTSTPGVDVFASQASWRRLGPGESASSATPFLLWTRSGFAHGTPIELELTVKGDGYEKTTLFATVFTGTPLPTTLLSEDFDGSPSLPAGWVAGHGAGVNVVPWRVAEASSTRPGFCGATSNGAFHQNAFDAPSPTDSPSRWERLISPTLQAPLDAEHVTVEFDLCYDTEDDPSFRVLAYDGLFLRLTDVTAGHTLRSVLAEAFADQFQTGSQLHYPKHFPRSSDPAYFEDMSAWAGDSGGVRHVSLRLPGMAGTSFQLRFEFTQDGSASCSDVRPGHACGVLLDNVVVKSVKTAAAQP